MAPAQFVPLGRLLLVLTLSLFWGGVMWLTYLVGLIKHGPRKYFYKKPREARPDVLDNPALGTHHTARLKNVRLHYVSKGPQDAPLVLFVHGFPELWYTWRFQLKEFGKDFRAVAIDMRGYSESERPQGVAEYRMETLGDDIKEFVEYLGYKKCYLVAHDWGGLVSWHVAAKYPEIVEKLVVCNAPHYETFSKHLRSSYTQLLKSWYMFFFQLPWFPEVFLGRMDLAIWKDMWDRGISAENMTDDDKEAYIYTFKNSADLTGPINYYRALLRYRPDPNSPVRVPVPTLIIWGTNDMALEKQMAEASKSYVDGECRVAYVEGASHWVQMDKPEIVNRKIRQFFEGK